MNSEVADKKILLSLKIATVLNWRDELANLNNLAINELALFLDDVNADQRREIYRYLKNLPTLIIPFVQITGDFEEWELDYLTSTHQTEIFGLSPNSSGFSFMTTLANFSDYIAIENPFSKQFAPLFSEEALNRANINKICLDLRTLENDRRYHNKKYLATQHVLDHHELVVAQIGPISENFFKKLFHSNNQTLTTLTDLHYLKNIPKSYLAKLLVLELSNSLEEQIEVREYIKSFFA